MFKWRTVSYIYCFYAGHRVHTVYIGTHIASDRRHSHRRHKHHRNSHQAEGVVSDNTETENRPSKFGVVFLLAKSSHKQL